MRRGRPRCTVHRSLLAAYGLLFTVCVTVPLCGMAVPSQDPSGTTGQQPAASGSLPPPAETPGSGVQGSGSGNGDESSRSPNPDG